MSEILLDRFLDVFNRDILPLTYKGVDLGNKIFGAAIMKKEDYSLVVAGTNNEIENPLWHGEIHTLKKFYEINKEMRPDEKNCIFLSSHEPCSLCLSAITFSVFDNLRSTFNANLYFRYLEKHKKPCARAYDRIASFRNYNNR